MVVVVVVACVGVVVDAFDVGSVAAFVAAGFVECVVVVFVGTVVSSGCYLGCC